VLFTEEAGGLARTLDGSSYRPSHPRPVLVAQNAELWNLVREDVIGDVTRQ
jgi:hypothetical protein